MTEDERSSLQLVRHRDREILRLDYMSVQERELPAHLDAWLAVITARPLRSVRVVVLPHSHFGPSTEAIRRFGERATPHVLALALVTTDPFHRALLWSMAAQGPKHIAAFDDEPTARDWLAAVEA